MRIPRIFFSPDDPSGASSTNPSKPVDDPKKILRGQKTILVVDDEEMNRVLFQRGLSLAGYKVLIARDGEEALNILSSYKIDLIVSDTEMPKVSGIELSKKREQNIPFILMSAKMESLKHDGSLNGLNLSATFQKPFRFEEVIRLFDFVLMIE